MWSITPKYSLKIVDAVIDAGSSIFHSSGLALEVAGMRDFKFGAGNRIQTEVFGLTSGRERRVEGSKAFKARQPATVRLNRLCRFMNYQHPLNKGFELGQFELARGVAQGFAWARVRF